MEGQGLHIPGAGVGPGGKLPCLSHILSQDMYDVHCFMLPFTFLSRSIDMNGTVLLVQMHTCHTLEVVYLAGCN